MWGMVVLKSYVIYFTSSNNIDLVERLLDPAMYLYQTSARVRLHANQTLPVRHYGIGVSQELQYTSLMCIKLLMECSLWWEEYVLSADFIGFVL